MSSAYTPDAIRTIIRNAGRVPPERIAADLGWPLARVERIAREQNLDMRVAPPSPPPTATAIAEDLAFRRKEGRYGNITVNLSHTDHQTMLAKAKDANLRRATLLAALIKGALATGVFDSLVAAGRKELGQ